MKWRIVLAIAQKDIVDAIKNLYILFALILPIGMSLLFYVAFPDQNATSTFTVAVYDPGGSNLVSALRALPDVRVLDVTSEQQLPGEVEKSAVGGLVVPPGFDAAIQAGERPKLTVYVNRQRSAAEIGAFRTMVEQQVWALVHQQVPAHVNWVDVAKPATSALGPFNFGRYLLIVFLVMGLSMTGTFAVPTLLVEEKEKHTLDSLLVSPAGPAEVVAGKALTGLVYSFIIAGVLIALNKGWEGNWPVTLVAVLLGSLFLVGVGLWMGSLFHNSHQVNTWSSIVMLVLMFPSWFDPLGLTTPWLNVVARLVPTHYMVQALQLTLAGKASLAQVWSPLAILAGCTLVAFVAVVWTLQRDER